MENIDLTHERIFHLIHTLVYILHNPSRKHKLQCYKYKIVR